MKSPLETPRSSAHSHTPTSHFMHPPPPSHSLDTHTTTPNPSRSSMRLDEERGARRPWDVLREAKTRVVHPEALGSDREVGWDVVYVDVQRTNEHLSRRGERLYSSVDRNITYPFQYPIPSENPSLLTPSTFPIHLCTLHDPPRGQMKNAALVCGPDSLLVLTREGAGMGPVCFGRPGRPLVALGARDMEVLARGRDTYTDKVSICIPPRRERYLPILIFHPPSGPLPYPLYPFFILPFVPSRTLRPSLAPYPNLHPSPTVGERTSALALDS
ncbi:hypothetical protein NMY22_g10573 [Coprinellus aureogranulatus]|nr:hypothetical protein NMY22_g10573 [Coprinellus aureogranulatus]